MTAPFDPNAVTPEGVRPKVSLTALVAIADWKEALQGRIECARVRLNLGLPDNDPHLVAEVAEFSAECRRLCGEIRDRAAKRCRRAFSLQADLALLEREIERIGDVVLVVIDPVSSYLGKTDSRKNAEVRGVLEPIGEMAQRLRVAILSVTHFSKSGGGAETKALHRFIGSIAFVGAPRIALAVIEDAEKDRRLLLHAKNNLAPSPSGLAYRIKEKIVGKTGQAITAPYVVWDPEPVTVTANEALAAESSSTRNCGAQDEAKELLREILSDGPVAVREIQEAAKAHMISAATLRRAKDALGLRVTREGFGPGSILRWGLPHSIDAHQHFIDAHVPENEHLWEKSQKSAKVMSTYGEHLCEAIDSQPASIDAHRNGGKPIDAQTPDVSTYGEGEHLCADNALDGQIPDLPAFLDRRPHGPQPPLQCIVRKP